VPKADRLTDRLDCCKEPFEEKRWPLSLIGTILGDAAMVAISRIAVGYRNGAEPPLPAARCTDAASLNCLVGPLLVQSKPRSRARAMASFLVDTSSLRKMLWICDLTVLNET
jgi:hypothetical protein